MYEQPLKVYTTFIYMSLISHLVRKPFLFSVDFVVVVSDRVLLGSPGAP